MTPTHGVYILLLSGALVSEVYCPDLSSAISDKNVYGVKGKSVELLVELPQGTNITSVTWKWGTNKAAEWFEGDEEPTYFAMFKSTATLDMKTWTLTISKLQEHFSGKYSAVVNNMDPTSSVILTIVDAVLYGVIGKSITLPTELMDVQAESAFWTLNKTVIALWDEEMTQIQHFYQNTEINDKTWSLTISDLGLDFSGLYAFRLNELDKVKYELIVAVHVLDLSITKQCNKTICTLHCSGMEDANIQVTWTDNKGRKASGPVLRVEKSEHPDMIYTCSCNIGGCNAKNITEKELFPDSLLENAATGVEVEVGVGVGVGVGVIVVVVVVVGVVLLWRKWQKRQQPLNQQQELALQQQPAQQQQLNGQDQVLIEMNNKQNQQEERAGDNSEPLLPQQGSNEDHARDV